MDERPRSRLQPVRLSRYHMPPFDITWRGAASIYLPPSRRWIVSASVVRLKRQHAPAVLAICPRFALDKRPRRKTECPAGARRLGQEARSEPAPHTRDPVTDQRTTGGKRVGGQCNANPVTDSLVEACDAGLSRRTRCQPAAAPAAFPVARVRPSHGHREKREGSRSHAFLCARTHLQAHGAVGGSPGEVRRSRACRSAPFPAGPAAGDLGVLAARAQGPSGRARLSETLGRR